MKLNVYGMEVEIKAKAYITETEITTMTQWRF